MNRTIPISNEVLPCRFIYRLNISAKSMMQDQNPSPVYKFALLNHCCQSEEDREKAKPVVAVIWKGKKDYFGIVEVEEVFGSREDALAYAEMNTVPMAWLPDEQRVEYLVGIQEDVKLPADIRTDLVIREIEKQLPEDWEMIQSDEDKKSYPQKFTLKAKYKVWQTRENLVNAPADLIDRVNSEAPYINKAKPSR